MSVDKHIEVEEFINHLALKIDEFTIAKGIVDAGMESHYYSREYEGCYKYDEGLLLLEVTYDISWAYHCDYYETSGPEYTLTHFSMNIRSIKATYYGNNPINNKEELNIPIELLQITEQEIINQANQILE